MNHVTYLFSMHCILLGYSFQPRPGAGGGGEFKIWISSERDDRMVAKLKPKYIPGPKFNPQKIPC